MKNCPNCGATIPPGSFCCGYCGTIFYDEMNAEINRLRKEQEELRFILETAQAHTAWEYQTRNLMEGLLYRWW